MARFLAKIRECIPETWIGFPGVVARGESDTGLDIRDIPGVSELLAESILEENDHEAKLLFQKVYRRALSGLVTDYTRKLSEYLQFREVSRASRVGKFSDTDTIAIDAATEYGVEIEKFESDHTSLVVEAVRIRANGTGTVTVVVEQYGADTTTDFEVVPGVNVLRLDQIYFEPVVRIYLQLDEVGIDQSWNCSCGNDVCQCPMSSRCSWYNDECCFRVKGVTRPFGGGAVTDSATLNGLELLLSCESDPSYFICKFRHQLATPLWYRMGIEFYHEVMSSRRGNAWASDASKENAVNMLIHLNGGKNPDTGFRVTGEYWKSLTSVVEGTREVVRTLGDFECTSARVVKSLP